MPSPAELPDQGGHRPQLLGAMLYTHGRLFTHGQGPEAGQCGETIRIKQQGGAPAHSIKAGNRIHMREHWAWRENRELTEQRSVGLQIQALEGEQGSYTNGAGGGF